MFDDLLRIREFRETSAANEVARVRRVVADKQQAVRDAEAAVQDYRDYRLAEESRLFAAIRGARVKLRKLEDMKQSIALMRDHELKLEEAVEQAKKALEEAEEELQRAVDAYHEAQKSLRKFEEFVAAQKDMEHKAAERKEEAEVEEVSEATYAARMRGTD